MALKCIIKRFENNSKATVGELELYDGEEQLFKCYTLENPKIGPERQQDLAIPEGTYTLDRRHSPKFSNEKLKNRTVPWVYNDVVPKEAYVLMHNGNNEGHTEGCILLGAGTSKDADGNIYMVTNSVDTVNSFLDVLDKYDISGSTLEIENKF